MGKLLIVESPTKAKTIKKFFGRDFPVVSSMGHVRDLPKSKLGVDVKGNFEPEYQTVRGKGKVLTQIRKKAKETSGIVMATDPDREGEAIAWHLTTALKLPVNDVERVVFHEITESALKSALKDPKKIDMDLVDAQQGRRILDRLVGYKLSPFLWKKIRYGLSAGRVQSVAVRLIVEREREREEFDSRTFWKVHAFAGQEVPEAVDKLIISEEGEEDKAEPDAESAEDTLGGNVREMSGLRKSKDLWDFVFVGDAGKPELDKDKKWIEKKIEELPSSLKVSLANGKEGVTTPPPPFVTSTLQRAAFSKFGYSAKRTMRLAQALYEGGLITYMRTDSVRLSSEALKDARSQIGKTLGKEYLPEKPRFYRTKQKSAQEAHEAIRPTDFSVVELPGRLRGDHKKIYDLIRSRALACQCAQAKVKRWTVEAFANKDKLLAKSTQLLFDGFYKISGMPYYLLENKTFTPKKGDVLNVHVWAGVEGHTPPPPRFTEASLVKELEKNGIGRPSTYASIIDTVINRGYVKREGRALAPTDNGYVVNDLLVKHFPKIVDLKFTAGMEKSLDDIAEGKADWRKIVADFYGPFAKNLIKKDKEIDKKDVVILGESEEKCPECSGPMVIRLGKYGKFLSCKKFPECKGMKPFEEDLVGEKFWDKYEEMRKCPECGGAMALKTGRFGRFWACEKYPKCKSTAPLLLKEKCPECGSNLVERKSKRGSFFIGCSGYPKCKYIKKTKKK